MITRQTRTRDAFGLLRADHEEIREIFKRFERARDLDERKDLVEQALRALKIHAAIEEELFYPVLRRELPDHALVDQADEEHHVARLLAAELDLMSGEEDGYVMKFRVLAENVLRHLDSEEDGLFKAAAGTDIDFGLVGQRMDERRKQLASQGVPRDAESAMVRAVGLTESPSRQAAEDIDVPKREPRGKRRGR